ncbi:FKBP-type peptidyl-prolyl cis-trans isomerase [Desulfuromonas sp. TF]|jgi:FKBP-type peptidyl-prolyl cis-trans isomerase FklB|uniref:FKBP-type peptidyl-prolyl cis-trans isomerase n=1 Tax=Desulfuromonas sp. TF TaxID=1232410 RepID=UPI00041CD0BB|nr:FKBP-type peptidyl-prolyl cis-trans isomerase [Desulfuromonas sp. TF]
MKRQLLAILTTFTIVLLAIGCTAADKTPKLETLMDKVSYSIGLNIGKDFKSQNIEVNPELLARGIKDAISDTKPLLTDEEIQEAIGRFQQERMAEAEEMAKAAGEKNRQEGESFLLENAKKEGVVTLPSGLQYKVIEEGTGKSPEPGDQVTVHYRGTLVDGTEFDSSYERGEPVTFPVGGVIPGWTEALQLMKEGAKWQLFIPPSLAYGEKGAGQVIGPNSTLIFDVELISVQ